MYFITSLSSNNFILTSGAIQRRLPAPPGASRRFPAPPGAAALESESFRPGQVSSLAALSFPPGGGLPETVKGALFQPGQTSKEQGSGLGLAISGQLAASMGAELLLAKSDENGTTFRLTLAKRNS